MSAAKFDEARFKVYRRHASVGLFRLPHARAVTIAMVAPGCLGEAQKPLSNNRFSGVQ